MNILLITNLYPPQELGGYGRCMADFCWGLIKLGHKVRVLASNAPYLGPNNEGPNGEEVNRSLELKGSFENRVTIIENINTRKSIDDKNKRVITAFLRDGIWDGILIGNIDLLGPEILPLLTSTGLPVLHHIGFVAAPYEPIDYPRNKNYKLISASKAVREEMIKAGLPITNSPVVYPGARIDLLGMKATGRSLPELPNKYLQKPLKVCFAGLLMGSKGAHTLIEALVYLHRQGINIQANLAGREYDAGYIRHLELLLQKSGLEGLVRFVGELKREQLARFFRIHHACVFPSIYPEAFGIVGAEAMASGLVLLTSGVGGAKELIEDNKSGILFPPGDSLYLANSLARLIFEPKLIESLALAGKEIAESRFSVMNSAKELERLFTLNH